MWPCRIDDEQSSGPGYNQDRSLKADALIAYVKLDEAAEVLTKRSIWSPSVRTCVSITGSGKGLLDGQSSYAQT